MRIQGSFILILSIQYYTIIFHDMQQYLIFRPVVAGIEIEEL